MERVDPADRSRGLDEPEAVVGACRSGPGEQLDEIRADRDGPRTRPAAAVGRGERLVQVEMHDVEAHVPRPDHAEHRVEVGPVVVEQAPHVVDHLGDLDDLLLEKPQRVRVREHDPGDVGSEDRAEGLPVDETAGVGADRRNGVAAERHRRRVRAVGRLGDDDPAANLAVALVVGAHEEQPRQLPRRAGGRLQRRRRHARDGAERLLQLDEHLQPSLRPPGRCRRVDLAKGRDRRGLVTDLRVVLHRARAERVRPEIDAVLAVRQPGEMADEVALGDLRERDGLGAQMPGRHELGGRPLRQAGRAQRPGPAARGRQLEDRRLAGPAEERRRRRPPAGGPRHPFLGHRITLANAAAKPSISAAVRRSVTATSSAPSAAVPANPSRTAIPAR